MKVAITGSGAAGSTTAYIAWNLAGVNRCAAFVWLLLVAFQAASQTPPPHVPATELVRQTVAHELAAANASNFHRMSNDLTLQQGVELLLNPR